MDMDTSLNTADSGSDSLTQADTDNSSSESNNRESQSDFQTQQEIYELEKLGKFKFQGKDLTVDDLKKGFAFQQDYTKKSQKLAEERKAFEAQQKTLAEDQKFQSNYEADLKWVLENPKEIASRALLYMKTYPDKYHAYLQQALSNTQSINTQQQGPSYEQLQMENKINRLEKFYNDQEIAKNTNEITKQVDGLKTKYPKAIPELVIGRVYEAYNQMLEQDPQARLPQGIWEKTFKSVDQEIRQRFKDEYSTMVKKQTETNAKSKDVATGGSAVGRAPHKFKNLSDVTKFAAAQLSKR
jgi:hypothetical protein